MTRQPSELDKVADAWVDKMAEMSPSFATYIGKPGGEDKLDDASPEGQEEDARQMRRVLGEVNATATRDKVDEAMQPIAEVGKQLIYMTPMGRAARGAKAVYEGGKAVVKQATKKAAKKK